jgi:2-oxoglutarate ferredoxin oxidoreductase subunit beta
MTYRKDHAGEVVTGVLFADENTPDLHEMNNTRAQPLAKLPFEKLCPGAAALDKLQEAFR